MAGPEVFDVCVVGTGAGGGVMIQELTAAGFRVVALQRGPLLSTDDFVDDELKVMIRDGLFSPHQVETFRPDDATPAVAGRFNAMADCVGGTMTHWSAWSWRFRPDDFRVRSHEGTVAGASLADWPFPYEEIEPFYERAEWDFGVAGNGYANPFGAPRKKDYPNPPHPERVSSRRFARAAEKLGYHPFPLPVAINSRPYRDRPTCMYGGACYGFGCPVHAKATSLSVCIPKARASGKLDLRPNVMAREITVGKDGRARSVRYLDEQRREHEVLAKQIVVSGNSIGSPHLLSMSKSGAFPQGLANSSGMVGKNLMFHTVPAAAFLLDEPALGVTGFNGHVAVDDLHPSDAKRGFIRGGVIGEPNAATATPMFYWVLGGAGAPMKQTWGAPLKDFLRGFPRSVLLAAVLEDLPMEKNRIDLDPKVKDRFGLPAPRITHGQHANDLAMHRWYQQKLLEIADAAGAKERWLSQVPGFTHIDEKTPMNGGHVGHYMGTCRMGTDPKDSVLDKWCRTHDVPNLWIVDGSCFPTSGGYNPTLTILANAFRVADHFVAEAKRQNL
jgi:choline dehydrogenase-like flavoprotein